MEEVDLSAWELIYQPLIDAAAHFKTYHEQTNSSREQQIVCSSNQPHCKSRYN